MFDLHDDLCALPVDLRVIVLSNIEHVQTRQILASSSTFREAFSRDGALPRTFDYEGVAGDDIADHLVHVLDRVRSLGNERALELMGDEKDRLCEYACGRNCEVLKWAFNELNLPWAPYPPEPVNDDILALRMLREKWPKLKERWSVAVRPEEWGGVTMEDGRVVKLSLPYMGLGGAVPAEIWQLTSLRWLDLRGNQLTSLPAEIGLLTLLNELNLSENQLSSLPAEIRQLASLQSLHLDANQLTSVPAEIGQLTLLMVLSLGGNQLTSVPVEIGQLTSLTELSLYSNQLTSLPAVIGQLTSLDLLFLYDNQLTSLPAEIGQITSLQGLDLRWNRLTTLPAAIGELEAAGCEVYMDDDVTFDE